MPRAPVGRFFYWLMGTTAALPIIAALLMPMLSEAASFSDPPVWAAASALLAYPLFSGAYREDRGKRWAFGLAWALAWTKLVPRSTPAT